MIGTNTSGLRASIVVPKKPGCGDADDGEEHAVDGQATADDVGGAAELAGPVAIADHRDRMLSNGLIVGPLEQASHLRPLAQQPEVFTRDQLHAAGFRLRRRASGGRRRKLHRADAADRGHLGACRRPCRAPLRTPATRIAC